MFAKVGNHYYFTFKIGFESLTGIYRVIQRLDHEELLRENGSLEAAYVKAGKTPDDHIAERDSYKDRDYLKVEFTNDNTIFYISELLFDKVPDDKVSEYIKLTLGYNLGIFAHPDDLAGIETAIGNMLSTNYGIVAPPVKLQFGTVWMRDTEYKTLDDARIDRKGTFTNTFSELQRVQGENTNLKSYIAELEAEIIRLSS